MSRTPYMVTRNLERQIRLYRKTEEEEKKKREEYLRLVSTEKLWKQVVRKLIRAIHAPAN